ncbi:hypothetical protein [Actinomadura sp. 7K507]|uniref:AlkZ-related protein n=1 Tax=Actinomadura sp. 7K507 TaxID=2530365 RepID=UPI001044AB75|nr:hypothetical protein [Actinomadura sp. 7K507]TDC75146.1 hypothetical protein E1285_41865 [Actinomadura sp. 7K507]
MTRPEDDGTDGDARGSAGAVGALHELRLKRWGMDRPPLATIDEAADFIDDVGFALLFGDSGATFPALREAARDDASPRLAAGWGEDLERMWTWKDELPALGRAWVGRFALGRQSLLSPRLLSLLLPSPPETVLAIPGLSVTARTVLARVEAEGPTSMRVIRQDHGLNSRSAQKVLDELGRALLVTNHGTAQDGPGWPSCVIEVTTRAFPDLDPRPVTERRKDAALTLLDAMVEADARQLSRAFRWPHREAKDVLETLARANLAEPTTEGRYRPRARRGR